MDKYISLITTLILLLSACSDDEYYHPELVETDVSGMYGDLYYYGYVHWNVYVINKSDKTAKEVFLIVNLSDEDSLIKSDTIDYDWVGSGLIEKKDFWSNKFNPNDPPNLSKWKLETKIDHDRLKF